MAGYSSTPLTRKLGITCGAIVYAIAAPKDYARLLAPLPDGVVIVAAAPKGGAAIVHLFVENLAALDKALPRARKAMRPDGALWVSWYKKAAKIPTDVTEHEIRRRALATDLVDIKVCAVSEVWSGLKFVVRKHLR